MIPERGTLGAGFHRAFLVCEIGPRILDPNQSIKDRLELIFVATKTRDRYEWWRKVEATMRKRPMPEALRLERSGNVIQFPLVRTKPKSAINFRRYWLIGGLLSRLDRNGCAVVDIGRKHRQTAARSR